MSAADADYKATVATITTAHQISEEKLRLYDIFCKSRAEVWQQDLAEDKKIHEIFNKLGAEQAAKAVADAEAELYNKESEGDILNAVIKKEEEQLYTKNELRDAIRDMMMATTPMTEEEVKQFQDEEAERYKKIVERENGKF